ncbi:MAG: RNA-binding cell elongation regulator Jag/EloR [Bacillota bacterium]|nr:RNA-binding cell elongation regulator Jag/EloR [Bacillota bacterium]
MEYSEKWGVDVEEAVKLALMDLKVSRDEVDVIILEEPSKGFFGIGSKLAKVRVEKKKPEIIEEKVEEKTEEPVTEENRPQAKERRNDKKKSREKKEKKHNKEEKPAAKSNINIEVVNKDELTDIEEHEALTFLSEITEKMGLSLNLKAKAGDGIIYLEMDGKDSGTVIGKRGQTLDAIQYLTSLVVNKDSEKYIKVVVDAENYRAKRQKTLEQLANRLASKVIKTKKQVRLEPMNPYERKVIHATLQQNPNITTRSEGEEPYRRVVIELKK